MSKRKCNSLTAADKLKLLSVCDSGKLRDELCTEFNVPKPTLYRIIQNKEKIRFQCAEGQFRPLLGPVVCRFVKSLLQVDKRSNLRIHLMPGGMANQMKVRVI